MPLQPSPDAQEAFLRSFHAEHPAVTSMALGEGRTVAGQSSYELLREQVSGYPRVLDLGCGDGVLLALLAQTPGRTVAGADLSREALALARQQPVPADTALVECRAQQLPFVSAGFDAVVSHMALMLMRDVDQVLAELARVLRPGGLLACALGGGAVGGEAYALFLRLLRSRLDNAPAEHLIPRLGDRRTRERESFEQLLRTAGFEPLRWESARIDLSGPLEQVWATVSGIYDLGPLPARDVASLRRAFLTEAAALEQPDGMTPCAMDLRLARARLRT